LAITACVALVALYADRRLGEFERGELTERHCPAGCRGHAQIVERLERYWTVLDVLTVIFVH
jgi:hypothetical protein